jgi:hypothetical protein
MFELRFDNLNRQWSYQGPDNIQASGGLGGLSKA